MTIGTTVSASNQQELRQSWQTQPALFNQLHSIFAFTVDACASAANALLPRYWTKEDDCTLQDWSQDRVFCNPPFKNISVILAKAPTAQLACFLLPLTALGTRYFGRQPPKHIVIPHYRIKFDPPEGLHVKQVSPSLGTALLLYGNVLDQHLEQLKSSLPAISVYSAL